MPKIEKVYIEFIRRDGGTQPRTRIDPEVCQEYAEQMRAGQKFPPIDVYFDGDNCWLVDGFHRLEAHASARPDEPIECQVFEGTLEDAKWHSYGVNKTHGLRRSNEDKALAVKAALRHPNSAGKSDAVIADYVGVCPNTIRRYRALLSAQGKSPTVTKRTGRDGRTINTARIGRRQRKPVRPHSVADSQPAPKASRPAPGSTLVKLDLPTDHVQNCAYDLLEYFPFEYLQEVFAVVTQLHQQRQRVKG